MSDFTDDEMAAVIAQRPLLFQLVAEQICVEQEMRDSATIKAFMRTATETLNRTVSALCETSPADTVEIARLLVDLKMCTGLKATLEEIIRKGHAASETLRGQELANERDE